MSDQIPLSDPLLKKVVLQIEEDLLDEEKDLVCKLLSYVPKKVLLGYISEGSSFESYKDSED